MPPARPSVSGLRYYPDTRPGITRQRRGRGFSYVAADGTRIDCREERARLAALAVPPAYEDVWICPFDNGHLLATGRDARRRKQYRYHPDWAEFRARRKYDRLAEFGAVLPALRRRVAAGLRAEAGDQEFALAAITAMLDRLALRIGSPQATAENGTFGATTLRTRHLRLNGKSARLSFTAKGGRKVTRHLDDKRLNRILQKVDDLPGAELFTWLDDAGQPQPLSSEQVNAWLAEASGREATTAKEFRTWNGTLAAFRVAQAAGEDALTIKAMAEAAAEVLHNTETIARNSYIHPALINLVEADPAAREAQFSALQPAPLPGLRADEGRLLAFLERL